MRAMKERPSRVFRMRHAHCDGVDALESAASALWQQPRGRLQTHGKADERNQGSKAHGDQPELTGCSAAVDVRDGLRRFEGEQLALH
jgi:hypothetical protein